MLALKSLILLFSAILFGCSWASSLELYEEGLGRPKLEYTKLFLSSSPLTSSPEVDAASLLSQAIQDSRKDYYYWLLSHSSSPLSLATKAVELLPPSIGNLLELLQGTTSSLEVAERVEKVSLMSEISAKISEYYQQSLSQENDKLDAFMHLSAPLKKKYSGEKLRVLVHELAYFLNLLPFEACFDALRMHRQQLDYTNILVNTLGDSLLDGGAQLDKFYNQFEATVDTFGYSPKDLIMFQGSSEISITGAIRDIFNVLVARQEHGTMQHKFLKRMWRAACTLHLTAAIQFASGVGSVWDEEFAPRLYQAIEVGSTEVFNSRYSKYNEFGIYIGGHVMLVEVHRSSETHYRVRQFNSGAGNDLYHKGWPRSPPRSVERYLGFVNMPKLSKEQIKQTGYYFVKGGPHSDLTMIEKLYTNKPLAQDDAYTDPMLYERPQQAGTCAASSRMFYLRSFGIWGRLLEIDFKVTLIRQLLGRIHGLQRSKLTRTALIQSMKAEREARSSGDGDADKIREEREQVLKDAHIEKHDQYVLAFPGMFLSLISSALNELLASFYWIISNGRSDVAKTLFEHFLQSTKPILGPTNPYSKELLERVSPLIRDLQTKLLGGAALPFELAAEPTFTPSERPQAVKDAISYVMGKILGEDCRPLSRDKLPTCFNRIIDAILIFPYAPELAVVTSAISNVLDFGDVPADLSYVLLDAMRTAYGDDFAENDKNMHQVAFAPKLKWDYHPSLRGSIAQQDYEDFGNEVSEEDMISHLAHHIYLHKGPIKYDAYRLQTRRLIQDCSRPTLEKLPICFYHLIKTIREYSDRTAVPSITALMRGRFNFATTPPALAFLLLDTMRSVYGAQSVLDPEINSRVAFLGDLPRNYGGRTVPPTDCENATDEAILRDWERVAACRFVKNGSIDAPEEPDALDALDLLAASDEPDAFDLLGL